MLGLQLPTDPRWASAAEMHLSDILTDHAYCEQKAASTAISLMITYPELSDLVTEMAALAREEMSHFEMVHKRILERGLTLGNLEVFCAPRRPHEAFGAPPAHCGPDRSPKLRALSRAQ
jgi:tRNA isopentenyl-2-thiomethyl-A-37 hydroxylase MiaE